MALQIAIELFVTRCKSEVIPINAREKLAISPDYAASFWHACTLE